MMDEAVSENFLRLVADTKTNANAKPGEAEYSSLSPKLVPMVMKRLVKM